MAPPRQRTTATVDDSRSEASSSTKELKGTSSKARKPANVAPATTSIPAKETKVTTATDTAVDSATTGPEAEQAEEPPRIPWPQMPLRILHDYRHAYRLSTPSAYSKPYNALLLSQGIGLRSPMAIAVRRAQLLARSGSARSKGTTPEEENGLSDAHSTSAGSSKYDLHLHNRGHAHMHRIIGQGRVSKEQLALAVRKHFNSAGLVEQEAIARFLYKVREEGKGRQFRLRFRP